MPLKMSMPMKSSSAVAVLLSRLVCCRVISSLAGTRRCAACQGGSPSKGARTTDSMGTTSRPVSCRVISSLAALLQAHAAVLPAREEVLARESADNRTPHATWREQRQGRGPATSSSRTQLRCRQHRRFGASASKWDAYAAARLIYILAVASRTTCGLRRPVRHSNLYSNS
jgi:hypothetical protein